ncbi:hypothetical protein BGW38_006840 [Lunasporangiospora selenospora]|uniref:Uncharacterized protein n=1 Tax=Lunasporangiospora selenospora TaxID=979761 RepID=A0A9P6G112_9FUNG|nr:hypothetical protein BGW38_006840 [Lunasporangiospora selenospora]
MLKVRLSVAGVAVPALSNLFPSDIIGKASISLTHLRYNIEPGMNLMISLMEMISANGGEAIDEFAEDMEKNGALEGADLCKLGVFLKNKDDKTVLGNLYRTVTDEGYTKWVCIDHYRMNHPESSAEEFQRVLDSIGGSFSENEGRVVVKLGSSVLANQFYSALGRARSVYELDIDFDWTCTSNDLEELELALRNSRVSVLRLDLQQFRTSIASNLLQTPTQYEVFFRIRDLSQVKVFHIVLSYENIDFLGMSPNTSTHASKISCELKLRATEGGRTDIGIITKALKANSTLTTLDLNDKNIGVDGATVLAEALRINSTLTTLELYKNNIGVDGAKALAEALMINSTLTTLNLNKNNIGVDGAKALAEALMINSTLTTLNLNKNNIRIDGVKALTMVLKVNSGLSNLNLFSNNTGVDGVKALTTVLKINPALSNLNMFSNSTRVDGVKALAEALKINSTLTSLYLNNNYIGDDGAKALAEALKINSALTTLDLQLNNIGVDGSKALAEALQINSSLTILH